MPERIGGDLSGIFVVMGERVWPWSDQRHLSSQNIHQLRKFVDAGAAQDAHAR